MLGARRGARHKQSRALPAWSGPAAGLERARRRPAMPKGGKKKVAPDVGCAGRGDEAWGERSGKKAKKKYAVDSPSPAATPPPDRCNGAPAVGACRQPACQPASQPAMRLSPSPGAPRRCRTRADSFSRPFLSPTAADVHSRAADVNPRPTELLRWCAPPTSSFFTRRRPSR